MHRALIVVALMLSSCSTESQICGRMATLCETPAEVCKTYVKDVREAMGEEGVAGMKACFSDAKTCNEASGCMMGLGLKSLTSGIGDFLKGLGQGLKNEK